jgi:anti-sigma B factor antagonist
MITLTSDESGDSPVLYLAGDLTIYNAAELAMNLLGRLTAGTRLDLDLEGVTELDTAGLQVLLVARREASTRDLPMRWLRPSAPVVQVIETFHLGHLLSDDLGDQPASPPPPTTEEGLES